MKNIIRAGILSLTFVFAFMFMAALAEGVAASHSFPPFVNDHAFIQGILIQARHDYTGKDPILHLNKHDLSLAKGKSETLSATLKPSGKSVSVKWGSSNTKIAKVSGSGKVTAVAPGTAIIIAVYNNNFSFGYADQTGNSAECYVTVKGGTNDAKPLGTSDQTYNYGKTKLKAPTNKYYEALVTVQKSIGGYAYYSEDYQGTGYYNGLMFGDTDPSKAHTDIYIYNTNTESRFIGYGFAARGASPIKTSRGIAIGAKKSTVQQLYGLPTIDTQYTSEGKTYDVFGYSVKTTGKGMYTRLTFYFLKSSGTLSEMYFYLGEYFR